MAIKLKHPTFPKISDEMKRWSVLLAGEMKTWPDIRIGSMFGMTSIYRGKAIFALLPDKRGLEFPNAIAVKRDGLGLSAALKQLEEAYRKAKPASDKTRV
ncbi:MAG TPA: hypothetical protein VF214_02355 [Edaphobacter sp.]